MTETKKQIEQLKKSLPGLKEKVFGVALLLCLSLVMVASVSYAWVTMSTNPEVGAVKTTVAANGALEIALSDFDGLEPEKSGTSDSFAAEGQTAHAANTSWGNLVNLSSGYGVDNLVLRPAKLDLTSPNYIYSMKYGQDGRVEGIISDFGFTTWSQTNEEFDQWAFVVPPSGETLENGKTNPYKDGAFGVRAISSVTMQGEEDINVKKLNILASDQLKVKDTYESDLVGKHQDNGNASSKDQSVLSKLVNRYVEHIGKQAASKMSGVGALVKDPGPIDQMTLSGSEYLPALTDMMECFYYDIILPTGETMVYTANLQSKSGKVYTLEMLIADDLDYADLLADNVMLTGLGYNPNTGAYDQEPIYAELYKKGQSGVKALEGLWNNYGTPQATPKATFYWGDIADIVENLVGITTLELEDKAGNRYVASKMVNMGGSKLLPLVTEELPQKADGIPLMIYLQDGMIVDFEKMSGASVEISVTIDFEIALGYGYSNAGRIVAETDHDNNCFRNDYALAQTALNAEDTRTMVAAETYGMVLDLWVRTNSPSAMLTLNGTPEVVERKEPVAVNIAGYDTPRNSYIYTYLTGETTVVGGMTMEGTESFEVYEVLHDPDGAEGTEVDGETVNLPEGYYFYKRNNHKMACVYEVQTNADGKKEPVETDTILYLDPADVEALVTEKKTAQSGKPASEQKTEDVLREEAVQELASELGLERNTTTIYDVVGYTAANRIWQDNDDPKPLPGTGEISTTQGSGSCYIFHASSNEEYENTKNLLKNLRLVFLDENGKELSRARLNTEQIFAENGKYTVPIYLESGKESITVVETDEEGNESTTVIMGLCRLEKNVARRISVVLYLEGENLTNDMVMSKDSVSGSLNLQFDSTADLHSVGDTELLTEVVKLSASLDVTSMEYNGQEQSSNLSAVITGLMPQRVEATFTRMYNATQGTVCKTISLEQGDDGYWRAEIPFSSPGRYVLEALTINGVDYNLEEPLEVNVTGFNIKSAGFAPSGAVLTVDRRATKKVTVQLASDVMPGTVVGQFVSEDEDGKKSFVNVDLMKIGELWEGNAAFTRSGHYTLTNLIMDGAIFELPAEMQQSFTAYLGLTADVTLLRYEKDENDKYVQDELGNYKTLPLNYDFTGPETIHAFVQIYDDVGNPLSSLGKVGLYYKAYGSSNSYGAFSGEVSWNGTEYVGSFSAFRAGRFVFGELQIRTSQDIQRISSARISPELSIRSTEPPVVDDEKDALVYINGTPYYKAYIENADMAGIWAVMSDGVEDREVKLEKLDGMGLQENEYLAQIPDRDENENTDYNANGVWTVKSILFDDVYANDTYYEPGGEKYTIDITDETYTVAHYLTVSTESILLGATREAGTLTVTGEFMHSYELGGESGIRMIVQAPIVNKDNSMSYLDSSIYFNDLTVNPAKLTYVSDSRNYCGGYTGGSSVDIQFTPVKTARGDAVILSLKNAKDLVMREAGIYKITGSVTLKGNSFNIQANHPSDAEIKKDWSKWNTTVTTTGPWLEIYSIKPTVSITDITLDGSGAYSIDKVANGSIYDDVKSSGGCGGIGATNNYTTHKDHVTKANAQANNYISRISDDHRTAWLYFKCSHSDDATYSDKNFVNRRPHAYAYSNGNGVPKATITLSGMGSADEAKLVFTKEGGGDVIMITQYTASGSEYWGDYATYGTDAFVWTADGTCSRFIGVMNNGGGQNGSDSKTVAGTIKATTLKLTCDGVEYTFTVPVITINNEW